MCVCLYLSDCTPLCIPLFTKDYSSSSSFLVTELCNTRPEMFTNRDFTDIINVLTSFFYNLTEIVRYTSLCLTGPATQHFILLHYNRHSVDNHILH